MVVERNRHLNQPLQKLLLGRGRGSPNVLQGLVSVEESRPVKQFDSLPVVRGMHRFIVAYESQASVATKYKIS